MSDISMAWERRALQATCVWVLCCSLALSITRPASAQTQEEAAKVLSMVRVFVTALTTRDGKPLASLYAEAPYTLCTDLDILVANELSGTTLTSELLMLKHLTKSEADLLGNPSVSALPGEEFNVVFGLTWTYQLPDASDERILTLIVSWRVQKRGGAYKITNHKTRVTGEADHC